MERGLVALREKEPRVYADQRFEIGPSHTAPTDRIVPLLSGSRRCATLAAVIPVAIGLALAAAVVHGTWNVLVKVSGDPLTTFQRGTVLAVLIITVPVAIAWFAIGRPSISVAAIAFAVASAVFELAYLWLLSNTAEATAKADRKSTRLNSSHTVISYAVFCLKKKNYNT